MNLEQSLLVGDNSAGELRIHVDHEAQVAAIGNVAEIPLDCIADRIERHLFSIDRDGPGLNLGEVKDVTDKVQQIRAGAVNGFGKFDLLRR